MARSEKDFAVAHDPTHEVGPTEQRFARVLPKNATRFIITAAQNATPVEPRWWRVLAMMAKAKGAELLVVPLRYKNPTSRWTGSQQNAEHWAEPVRPYLWNQRTALNDNLMLLADVKIQPTAETPLTGFDAMAQSRSGIIGHTKLQLRSIASPGSRMAKILTTTGACTVANYTDSRAGKTGEFHHSFSAVLVEIHGDIFHLRQLHFDQKTGSCTDLDTRYYEDRQEPAPRALALVMGDTHVDSICPLVERATFGPHGIVKAVRPEALVWNDLLDAYSVNPHHAGNPFTKVGKMRGKVADARAEVQRAITFIRKRTPADTQSVVVTSNHDDFLSRWIFTADWKHDPTNGEFYLETALAMHLATRFTKRGIEFPSAFRYWVEQANLPRTRVLDWDDSFAPGGVELGMHGNLGPNGAKGSIKNLRRVGTKSIIGHSHSPGIDEVCYQVGTSTRLRLEYNHGASSWNNCHCVLHADHKRQLVFIIDGKWRQAQPNKRGADAAA